MQIKTLKIANTKKLHPQIILLFKFPYIHIRTPIKNETIIDVIPTGLFNNSNIDSIISIKLYFMFALPFKDSLVQSEAFRFRKNSPHISCQDSIKNQSTCINPSNQEPTFNSYSPT